MSEFARAELGESDDPRALVPGNPAGVLTKAATLKKLGEGIDDIAAGLRRRDEGGWTGEAAAAFDHADAHDRQRFADAATALLEPAGLLEHHGHVLQASQNKANEAIELWRKAEAAQASYEAAMAAADADPDRLLPPPLPDESPREQARALLHQARTEVDNSLHPLNAALRTHTDAAPPLPSAEAMSQAMRDDAREGANNEMWNAAKGVGRTLRENGMSFVQMGAVGHQVMLHPAQTVSAMFDRPAAFLDSINSGEIISSTVGSKKEWSQDFGGTLGKAAVNIGGLLAGGKIGSGLLRRGADELPTTPHPEPAAPSRPEPQTRASEWERPEDMDPHLHGSNQNQTPRYDEWLKPSEQNNPSTPPNDHFESANNAQEVNSPTARPEVDSHPGHGDAPSSDTPNGDAKTAEKPAAEPEWLKEDEVSDPFHSTGGDQASTTTHGDADPAPTGGGTGDPNANFTINDGVIDPPGGQLEEFVPDRTAAAEQDRAWAPVVEKEFEQADAAKPRPPYSERLETAMTNLKGLINSREPN